jgi:hypothetical protein
VDVLINALQVTRGRIEIVDNTVKPPFSGRLSPIMLQARDVRWPAIAAKQLRLDVITPTQGRIRITGDVAPNGGTLQVTSEDVALSPYNSYVATYSSYRLAAGSLSVDTKVTFGEGSYDATNALTLHQLDIGGGGGESLFEREFGIPISMALALMKDTRGDITFDIPVQVGREGTQLDILAIAGQALREALVNALASPLKLFGAVVGGNQVAIVPPSIAVKLGRAELTEDGATRVEQLGTLLAARPSMAVELTTAATQPDARWLHEQALLKQWQGQGFLGSLREIAQGKTRDRVQRALEARAGDEPADLSAEDNAALDAWLQDVPPASPQQLQALAAQRLTLVAAALRDGASLDPARIRQSAVGSDVGDEAPVVQIQLQPLSQEVGQ